MKSPSWARVVVLAGVVLASFGRLCAFPVAPGRPPLVVQVRGVEVGTSLLLRCYAQLPEREEDETTQHWAKRIATPLKRFHDEVAARYTQGTLQRLADHPDAATRRAAVLALHLTATIASNDVLAARLHDEDEVVRQLAADALWAVWFRAAGEGPRLQLEWALQQTDPHKAVAGLTALVRKLPGFAEAYNQRAILYFQLQEYEKCAADCEKVLQLNKQHFGAAAGLGRCYLRLRLPQPALRAFRTAYRINPHLDGLEDAIRDLESILEGDADRDDREP
jgi:tetratricopeptide (TPR) repeat protein